MNRLNSGKADPLTARDRCRQWAPALRPDGQRGRSGLEGGGPGHCADCPGGGGRAGGPAGRGGAGRGGGRGSLDGSKFALAAAVRWPPRRRPETHPVPHPGPPGPRRRGRSGGRRLAVGLRRIWARAGAVGVDEIVRGVVAEVPARRGRDSDRRLARRPGPGCRPVLDHHAEAAGVCRAQTRGGGGGVEAQSPRSRAAGGRVGRDDQGASGQAGAEPDQVARTERLRSLVVSEMHGWNWRMASRNNTVDVLGQSVIYSTQ